MPCATNGLLVPSRDRDGQPSERPGCRMHESTTAQELFQRVRAEATSLSDDSKWVPGAPSDLVDELQLTANRSRGHGRHRCGRGPRSGPRTGGRPYVPGHSHDAAPETISYSVQ